MTRSCTQHTTFPSKKHITEMKMVLTLQFLVSCICNIALNNKPAKRMTQQDRRKLNFLVNEVGHVSCVTLLQVPSFQS